MQHRKQDQPPENKRRSDPQRKVRQYMMWSPVRPFTPPTDVIELAEKLMVLVEVAGMRPADFTITLVNHSLVINGVRERPTLRNAAYHQVEIGYGEFRVEVLLPWPVERDQVTATYREGFLQVDLPRRTEQQIRVVDVRADEEEHSQE
jgi:HSP20 family protein